jgi:hypothetical protein
MKFRFLLCVVLAVLASPVLLLSTASAGSLSLKQDEWTHVSPPRDLQGITLRALTRNYLDAAEFGSGWSVFKYLDTGVYQSASLDEPLEQGRGYWMITMGADIEIPLPANSHVTPDHALASCDGPCFGMALSSAEDSVSWNLLGYPYEFGQSFGQARVVSESGACASGCSPVQAEAAGQMSETIYHYDGAAYQLLDSNSMVQPWQGFWAASPAQSGGNPAELIFDNPIQSPLIGYWPLDDGSGLSAHDASGEDNPVTLTQAFWGPGRQQSGVCLSGTLDDEITSPGVANPQSLSIAAWIKPDADIEKWGWIGGFGDSAGLYIRRDGGLVMYIWDGATWPDLKVTQSQLQDKLELGAEGLYDGQWHHVVGSYDPVSGFSIHVDGVLIDSASAATGFNYGQGGQWHIGSMQGERNFSGCLDEVMVYGSVLSTAEIKALSDQESESTEPALNVAPQVSVGADQTIVLPQSASVSLSVTDDGRPAGGQLTAQWLQRSGPSVALPAVTFNSAGSGVSVFNFSQAGVYEFELIANDSDKQGSDTTRITVESGVDPVAGAICISEFQAADQDVIADEDGNYPDWIELHNPGGEAVSLANWCLTDDAGEPDQWCFESGTIAGNGYVVVFASKENRQTPNHHTNFKLGKGGDYLGLYNPSGEEVCAFTPAFPQQYDLVSYGYDAEGEAAYYGEPTPGSANNDGAIVVPLEIGSVSNVTMDVGEVKQISVPLIGQPVESLDFSASELPSFVEIGSVDNGVLTLTATADSEGVFGVTVAASNEWFEDSTTFLITVGDVGEPGIPPSLCITEFMAADQAIIIDENGEYPDWVEVHNPGDSPLSLSGWCLTDDEADPTAWCFSAGTLGADEYLVVFASEDDVDGPPIHTNFKLKKGGEYLGVYDPDGQPVCEYVPDFPQQYDNVSYGLDASGDGAYFGNPTPGAANDLTSIDVPFTLEDVADVSMDVDEVRVVQIEATGEQPSAVSFDGSALPSFAMLTDNGNGTASVRLQPDSAGEFELTVSASSGVFSDEVSFKVSASVALSSLDSVDQLELNWDAKPMLLDAANDRLFLSLGEQYLTARSHSGVFNYRHSTSGYSVNVNGSNVAAGANYSASVKHGDLLDLVVRRNGSIVWTLEVVVTNLPILEIFADDIKNDPKLPGTARWVDGDRGIDTGTVNLGIEYRGVSAQEFDKKPFGLEFRESDSEDGMDVQLLGLRDDDDWIADASYRDQSFARNIVTHDLYREMRPFAYIDDAGEEQGQSTVAGGLAEVILNSSYHGVYVMHERIDRKLLSLESISVPEDETGERWDLVDFDDPANGSVIYKARRDLADLTADSLERYVQRYPDADDIVYLDALEEIIAYTNDTSDAEFSATVGEVFDLDSLVDYWLITLAAANTDALFKNHYMARNQDGKWFFVPWDHDAAYGMTWRGGDDSGSYDSFQFDELFLLKRIGDNPSIGFYQMARDRWLELRESIITVEAITARFTAYAEQLDRAAGSAAKSPRERNLDRWPESGNVGAGQRELGQTDYIRNWLVRRMDYVDAKLRELAGE